MSAIGSSARVGATDAKVIRADDVVVDERVRAKCRYPTCPSYNTNMNCPPHTMELDEFRTLLGKYRYGILFKIDVTSGSMDDFKIANRRTLMNILWRTESAAFYDGHYFATGFGGTNCKDIFCPNLECAALAGKGCRNEFKARPGMHGMGIDVFSMAAQVGWTLYPAGVVVRSGLGAASIDHRPRPDRLILQSVRCACGGAMDKGKSGGTGLETHVASTLAYVGGWVSGLIVFF